MLNFGELLVVVVGLLVVFIVFVMFDLVVVVDLLVVIVVLVVFVIGVELIMNVDSFGDVVFSVYCVLVFLMIVVGSWFYWVVLVW